LRDYYLDILNPSPIEETISKKMIEASQSIFWEQNNNPAVTIASNTQVTTLHFTSADEIIHDNAKKEVKNLIFDFRSSHNLQS
jgi:hypothetical protein